MPVVAAKKAVEISRSNNPKAAILEAIGDLSGEEILFNNILVATYIRPERTRGGILLPQSATDEDQYQGKVGLVLKKGPDAFVSDDNIDFGTQNVEVGDWVVYRVGDGWPLAIRSTACRMITDRSIRMRIKNPEDIF